jgi:hypothetical protein
VQFSVILNGGFGVKNPNNLVNSLLPGLASGNWSAEQQAILGTNDPGQLADWFTQQELGAMAYLRLKEAELAAPVVGQLAAGYWQAAAAAAVKLELLARLQAAFTAVGLETVLLKGIAFYLTLYPDPAMRPMNDLDFWLRPSAIPAAWNALEKIGLHGKGLWPNPNAIPEHVTQLDFYPATPQTSPYSVEIHWDLCQKATARGRLPLERWWAEAQTVHWRGFELKVLSPRAALIHTAVHQMLEHRGELRWRWLLDIDQIIRGQAGYALTADDWQLVLEDSQASGVLPAVQSAIRLAGRCFATPLPEAAMALLATPAEQTQKSQLAAIVRSDRSVAGKLFLDASDSRGWQGKTAVIRSILLPHPNYMMQRYAIRHKALLPAYYLARLGKGAMMLLRKRKT